MNWLAVLNIVMWLLEKVMKDTDGDGRWDINDSDPNDPEVQ